MANNYKTININDLADLFIEAGRDLKAAMMNGEKMKEIAKKQKVYSELTLAMNRRRKSKEKNDNPAENSRA